MNAFHKDAATFVYVVDVAAYDVDQTAYDLLLYEDGVVHHVQEDLALFVSACKLAQVEGIPMILFLNKVDLLEEKLKVSPIETYFPDYNGDPLDVEAAKHFLRDRFVSLHQGPSPIHVEYTSIEAGVSLGELALNLIGDSLTQNSRPNVPIVSGQQARRVLNPISNGPSAKRQLGQSRPRTITD